MSENHLPKDIGKKIADALKNENLQRVNESIAAFTEPEVPEVEELETTPEVEEEVELSESEKELQRFVAMNGKILETAYFDNMYKLNIRFDKLTSHDITFVGIIQTARASGLPKFPMPYVLTN